VTGVQTCALPISKSYSPSRRAFFYKTYFAFAARAFACRRRVFLLLRQKKVTKEKATPGSLEIPAEIQAAKATA
jgi:hypothetical protein